jgi:ADP-ribose pyrophosphatase YjhB (NUDIX family)
MILKSFVLIEKDDRYLLIQEASFKWRGKWHMPGGNVKRGEDPGDAVQREALEEAGCDVKLQGIFYIKCFLGFFSNKMHIYYTGTIVGEKIKEFGNRHSMGAKWFTYEEIRLLPLRQKMLKVIERYRKDKQTIPLKNLKLVYPKSPLKKMI